MKRLNVLGVLCFAFMSPTAAQDGPGVDFRIPDINGKLTSLQEFTVRGPVYISFWALWCRPCRAELKALQSIYENHKDKGFTVLAINIDTPKSLAKVKSFVSAQRFTMPVLLDSDSRVFERLNGQNLPYSLLVNSRAQIVKTRIGYLPGEETHIEREILELLAQEQALR